MRLADAGGVVVDPLMNAHGRREHRIAAACEALLAHDREVRLVERKRASAGRVERPREIAIATDRGTAQLLLGEHPAREEPSEQLLIATRLVATLHARKVRDELRRGLADLRPIVEAAQSLM